MYLKINEKVLPFVAKLFTRAEKEKLKFIVTLREPVARYYSNYKHFAALALVEVLTPRMSIVSIYYFISS